MIVGIAFELPSGVLADLIGRRITVAIGCVIYGLGYIFISQGANFEQLLFAFSINAIGNSFISGAEEALVYDSLKQDKKLSLYSKVKSTESIIYRTTLLFSTVIGGYLYKIEEFLPYALTGLTLILAGIVYLFTIEPRIDSEKFSVKNYIKSFKNGTLESFKNKITTVTSLYYILIFSAAFMLMGYFEQPYTKWLGFSEVDIGWIFSILTLVKIATVYFAPKIEKKLSENTITILLPLITGMILITSLQNKIWGIIVLTVENVILAYRFIFTQNMYNKRIVSRYRASALSTVTMFTNLLYIGFVYLLTRTLSLERIGYSFNILAVLFIIASILGLYMKRNAVHKHI